MHSERTRQCRSHLPFAVRTSPANSFLHRRQSRPARPVLRSGEGARRQRSKEPKLFLALNRRSCRRLLIYGFRTKLSRYVESQIQQRRHHNDAAHLRGRVALIFFRAIGTCTRLGLRSTSALGPFSLGQMRLFGQCGQFSRPTLNTAFSLPDFQSAHQLMPGASCLVVPCYPLAARSVSDRPAAFVVEATARIRRLLLRYNSCDLR